MKGTDNQVVGPNSASKNFVNEVRARRSANGWSSLLDTLVNLIPAYGPWIIFGVIALESAGVPLPGETILVGAALLAGTTGQLSIITVVVAAAAGAIVGDGIGYAAGRRFGLPMLEKYGHYIRLDKDRLLIGRYLFFSMGASSCLSGASSRSFGCSRRCWQEPTVCPGAALRSSTRPEEYAGHPALGSALTRLEPQSI